MGKEFYFETDDRLDRKKYAEFLKTLLEHCDEYRREDSDGAYVIAIDSPWGTGKTRFAKMFRNYLEDRTIVNGNCSFPGPRAHFSAVYYNSWDTDFCEDALQPLIHTILQSPEFESKNFDDEGEKVLVEFKRIAIDVIKVAGYAILNQTLGETVTKMVKAAVKASSKESKNPLEAYTKRLKLLNDFKTALQKVIEKTKQKKLVILVDELDRCRPIFAIETLEIVKHLFDVPGLMFVFALDIKQLSCSVRTVYGQDMDATGYLVRFFDYIGQMQSPDTQKYISHSLGNSERVTKRTPYVYNNDIVKFIYESASCYNLKLRDISTIIQTYKLINIAFLHKYKRLDAHMIYICLIVIKYKDLELYNKILRDNSIENFKSDDVFKSQEQRNILSLCNNISLIMSVGRIKDYEYILMPNKNGAAALSRGVKILSVEKMPENSQIKIKYEEKTGKAAAHGEYTLYTNASLNNVLFFPDVSCWDKIKEMSLANYYLQQLEMFNFALPSDEPEKSE